MKPYKERLPEIDKAIFELSGEWPVKESKGHLVLQDGYGIFDTMEMGSDAFWEENQWMRTVDAVDEPSYPKYICTRTEFEARVADWRRLYEWLNINLGIPGKRGFNTWLITTQMEKVAELAGDYNWQLSLNENRHGSVNPSQPDTINHPSHYAFFDGTEAIEIIASSMSEEQFRGYCIGNKLKYCLRAGKKGDALEDLGKADKYEELFNKFKHLCRA